MGMLNAAGGGGGVGEGRRIQGGISKPASESLSKVEEKAAARIRGGWGRKSGCSRLRSHLKLPRVPGSPRFAVSFPEAPGHDTTSPDHAAILKTAVHTPHPSRRQAGLGLALPRSGLPLTISCDQVYPSHLQPTMPDCSAFPAWSDPPSLVYHFLPRPDLSLPADKV